MSLYNTLFLAGDLEAQKLCARGVRIQHFLTRHFLYSILISDSVNMPAGCYYQSEYTQKLVHRYGRLYLPGQDHAPVAQLSIGDDRASFAEDVEIKRGWFPEKYGYADTESTDRLTEQLKSIQPNIRSGKMRKRLTARISGDLAEDSPVQLVLEHVLDSKENAFEFVQPLKRVIEVQEYAILPTYIQIEMERHGIASQDGRRRWLDFILFKGYSQSCEEAYGCYCNNPLQIFYDPDFKRIHPYQLDFRDTNLFQAFLEIFPFPGLIAVERLSSAGVMRIKQSADFQRYLWLYQCLVGYLKEELQALLLDGRQNYAPVQSVFQEERQKELELCKKSLLNNTQEAVMLYRVLKNPFTKSKRFREWAARQDGFPTLKLLSCVKSRRNGILQEYIGELFRYTQAIKQNEGRNTDARSRSVFFNASLTIGSHNQTLQDSQSMRLYQEPDDEKQKEEDTIMKNISISLGKENKTKQKNSIWMNEQTESGARASIPQAEFKTVPVENLEAFKRYICSDSEIPKNCREAVLAVLNAKYSVTQEDYEELLDVWRERKKSFPPKVREAIGTAAGIANIGSLIAQLLGL